MYLLLGSEWEMADPLTIDNWLERQMCDEGTQQSLSHGSETVFFLLCQLRKRAEKF
jgi:hypothetical protein